MMKLLILDDDVQIREGIKNGIDWKGLGFEDVRCAGDGITGLKIASEAKADIVISDVRMPGMDGLEFLLHIKMILPDIKVILISGYDDFEYLQKAVQYHADDYELKPIKVRSLIKRVQELQDRINSGQKLPIEKNTARKSTYSRRIHKAIEYIHDHFSGDLSTDILADQIGVTPNYFSAMFIKETGVGFNAYITEERLKNAAWLLKFTNEQVSMVARKSGYRDNIYFSQVFKKRFGCSPSDYRAGDKGGKQSGG
jgi:two-component system sensor histidine kinase YesM